jgi:hypothetical protein
MFTNSEDVQYHTSKWILSRYINITCHKSALYKIIFFTVARRASHTPGKQLINYAFGTESGMGSYGAEITRPHEH